MDQLSQENPEEVGDLFLDVAEAFLEEGLPAQARPLLAALVETQNYGLVSTISMLAFSGCKKNVQEIAAIGHVRGCLGGHITRPF